MDQNSAVSVPTSSQIPSAQTSAPSSGSVIGDLLRTLGVGQTHVDEVHKQTQNGDVHQQIERARQYVTEAFNHARDQAQKNPAAVLGGLSALVIAAGMMRGHLNR